MKTKQRYFLKNKKIKEIKKELGSYEDIIPKKAQVEFIKIEDMPDILLVNNQPVVMQTEDRVIPTLKAVVDKEISEKYAMVDMGAINFVIKGADIMSPGIVDADKSIQPGETIIVIEESHKKPLAIGISLISGEEMIENDKGKAIENLHYVGDEIWDLKI